MGLLVTWLSEEESTLTNEIHALIKEALEERLAPQSLLPCPYIVCFCPLLSSEDKARMCHPRSREQPWPTTKSQLPWSWTSQPQNCEKYISVTYTSPNLWRFVTAAHRQKQRVNSLVRLDTLETWDDLMSLILHFLICEVKEIMLITSLCKLN